MLSWVGHRFKLKTELSHSGERFLPTRNMSCATDSMRSCVPWARRRDWLCWSVPTASPFSSSVWHWQQSCVCVINGAVYNSDVLSNHSSVSSVPLKQSSSRDSLGRWPTLNDVWSSSVLYMVSKRSNNKYFSKYMGSAGAKLVI